ncbi:Bifunctional ligase/repressor BirA [Rickettsiales endosymbiont of Paramecium tredecaurelia]|uniref:biotin--[acetyl-CoA-carboxylase] ligase n=1 Tax=Candidatus Sarmatiella mevalonica TaxID=2770581 RepID=UPI0019206A98|nr:biotin--[acetyl-CoA-carboxylase] ligase [Candidatus Sarmatiella mevalonica]MBL3284317.1 Bifunctional ligase/repressor BirA [Candidatus Sarmatiella mevalonica]
MSWLEEYRLLIFDSIDSTNSEALRLIKTGEMQHSFVIWSKEQTKGRGRYGKNWIGSEGNLYATIVLLEQLSLEQKGQLPLLAGLAFCLALNELTQPAQVQVKWPNDLMYNHQKLGGILVESIMLNKQEYYLVGVGINVNKTPHIDRPLTSLAQIIGNQLEVGAVLNACMQSFMHCYHAWIRYGFELTRIQWLNNAYNLGKTITFHNQQECITGEFVDIDLTGNLMIKLKDNQIQNFSIGHILS